MITKGNQFSGAEFSECERYRYSLWRTWTPAGIGGRLCAFIGLNPSAATHELDDPTIRRCIRFCQDWKFDGYVMLNIFAFRATDPNVMKAAEDPGGPHNVESILHWVNVCEVVVEAWGTHGAFNDQGRVIHDAIMDNFPEAHRKLRYLGLTAFGHPKHPLYLRADTKPMEWSDGRLPGTGSANGSAVEDAANVGFGMDRNSEVSGDVLGCESQRHGAR